MPRRNFILPSIAGTVWNAKDGVYILESCPPGYELAAQQCLLCPSSSYCPGGTVAPILCPNGLYSSPGSDSFKDCRQVVYVFTSISFPVSISKFLNSERDNLTRTLAVVSEVPTGDVQELVVADGGFGKTSVVYRLATKDAIFAALLQPQLSDILSNPFNLAIPGLPEGQLQGVTVSACQPGYELLPMSVPSNIGNGGLCELCPAGYYCSGGSSAPTPCPTSTFSRVGSNSSGSCTFAVFIIVQITLHIPSSNFTSLLQQKFVSALASASGVALERVSILSFSGVNTARRFDSSSVQVVSQIAAMGLSSANDISNNLDFSSLNVQLAYQGLPAATLDSVTVLASGVQSSNIQQWIVVLSVVGSLVVVLLTVLVLHRILHNKESLEEDRALKLQVLNIRMKFGLMPKDGFYLVSERPPFFIKNRMVVYLRQSHLEAAGRLALFRDFDIIHFDAFCLSLYVDQDAGSDNRYKALCQWLLELSEALISPEVVPPNPDSVYTTVNERFRFFVQKVGKARIWIDDEGLFKELKIKAQFLMDRIASQCHLRYTELLAEPRGQELVTLDHVNEKNTLGRWKVWMRNSLIRTFSSGPFSEVPLNAVAELCLAVPEAESTPQGQNGNVRGSSSVFRQDHAEVSWDVVSNRGHPGPQQLVAVILPPCLTMRKHCAMALKGRRRYAVEAPGRKGGRERARD